jgi:hypothetical protein
MAKQRKIYRIPGSRVVFTEKDVRAILKIRRLISSRISKSTPRSLGLEVVRG